MTTVSVFGGTGFLGRRVVQRLTVEGMTVRVAVRHGDRARSALRAAGLDRVTVFGADVRDQAAVAAAVAGADAVVDAVSAYVETAGVTFEAVHERGAETLAREAAAAGVARFVLVSGIGADPESASPYIRARGRGERAVQQAFPGATIVRPSAMFGPGDALFGTLAHLARLLPVLPLIGDGHTRLQPVYVEDVAEAVARILADPGTAGRTYELAGPTVALSAGGQTTTGNASHDAVTPSKAATAGATTSAAGKSTMAPASNTQHHATAHHKTHARHKQMATASPATNQDTAYHAALKHCVAGPAGQRESCLDDTIARFGRA